MKLEDIRSLGRYAAGCGYSSYPLSMHSTEQALLSAISRELDDGNKRLSIKLYTKIFSWLKNNGIGHRSSINKYKSFILYLNGVERYLVAQSLLTNSDVKLMMPKVYDLAVTENEALCKFESDFLSHSDI